MSYKIKKSDTAAREVGPDKTLSDVDMKRGYKVRPMDPLANMQTNEHNTTFYDEVTRKDDVTGEVVTGILERGNFLDRL